MNRGARPQDNQYRMSADGSGINYLQSSRTVPDKSHSLWHKYLVVFDYPIEQRKMPDCFFFFSFFFYTFEINVMQQSAIVKFTLSKNSIALTTMISFFTISDLCNGLYKDVRLRISSYFITIFSIIDFFYNNSSLELPSSTFWKKFVQKGSKRVVRCNCLDSAFKDLCSIWSQAQ